VAFRKIFGSEKNKDILIHFLNDMVTFKDNAHIQDVTFLKTVQDPDTAAKKTSIVDIMCKDQQGNSYIVEMQVAKERGFEKRAQYYAAKAYTSQMNTGGQYHNLKEVIFLAISNFVIFPNKTAYKSDHIIFDAQNHDHDLKDFSFTFVELPKFNKHINELTTTTEKWCYFFKYATETSEQDFKQFMAQNDVIERAYEELNRFSWNDEDILIYDQAEKYEWCYQASMDQKYIDGVTKGKAEGKVESLTNVAKNMLAAGMSLEQIAQLTHLSPTEIKRLTE